MSKVRVYELARELGVESKVLLSMAKTAGIVEAKSHQSTLSEDNAVKLRKIHSGDSKAGDAKKSAPRTVIRRRRKAETPAEGAGEEAAAAAEPEKTVASTLLKRKPAAAPEPEAKADEPAGDALAAAEALFKSNKKTEDATPPEAQVDEEPAPEAAAPETAEEPARAGAAAEEAPTPEAEAEATPEVAAAEDGGSEDAPAEAPSRRRRQEAAGATIVRRATPEEVAELESQNRKTGRQEDSRGTRVTGMGLLTNRVGPQNSDPYSDAPADPYASTGAAAGRGTSARDAAKRREEEAQPAAARARAKSRRANATTTMRALLDEASNLNKELTGEVAPKQFRGRTVYTPTSSSRRRDLKRRKDLKKTQVTLPKAEKRIVRMGESITVGDLSKQLSIKAGEIIKKLMADGVMATINQEIDADTATLIATEYKYEVKSTVVTVEDILKRGPAEGSDLKERAPIVTVMGHVDHGKTSILDAIRETDVVAGEAGGITQHIGAYSVNRNNKPVTFLDTPGHEAFSAMRARGAQVTDIVVLVVAADDGVMPQTVEAINHAKEAGCPLIVAVNKIDKPNINVDRVYTELTEHGVQSEEWGGETQFVKCSAIEKTGLDELLEAILLQAEVLELKADPKGLAEGAVIEAHLDKGRGPIATVVIQQGMLKTGDFIVAGTEIGRVRAMHDHRGGTVPRALPSTPVEIIGLSGVPKAGDQVNAVADEKTAREAAEWRLGQAARSAASTSSAQSLEDLLAKAQTEDAFEVPLIIKGDTQGSVEAVRESILKINTDRVQNKIVHAAVGGVTESDVTLAAASGAIIVGFNVRAARGLDEIAEQQGVMVSYFSIIYDVVDSVKAIMVGKLPPVVSEVVTGRAEVRKTISVPKMGTIAGSAVTDGKIGRNSHCRLIRDDIVVYEGKLGSLRRFKDDVKEVVSGYECGIGIEGYADIKEGDVIEAYILEESAATL